MNTKQRDSRWSLWGREPFLRYVAAFKALLLFVGFSSNGVAGPVRDKADADGDGLIEIYDLADLDAIRESPEGKSIYGRSDGCPSLGCFGFRLMQDLDFNTNGDFDADGNAIVDEDDEIFYEVGSLTGWLPIPTLKATFDGNEKTIRNLTISGFGDGHPAYPDYVFEGLPRTPGGLFSVLDEATIRDLRFEDVNFVEVGSFTGALAGGVRGESSVSRVFVQSGAITSLAEQRVGGIIGQCEDSVLVESYTSLLVQPDAWAGGLIGYADDCHVSRSFSLGKTASARYHGPVGGLVGYMKDGSFEDSFFSGSVGEGPIVGGLIGESEGTLLVRNSYVSGALIGNSGPMAAMLGLGDGEFISSFYATDTTGSNRTSVGGDAAKGVTLADLQCPIVEGDDECDPGLFDGWTASTNDMGQPVWNFGSADQVPALVIKSVIYRDSDGDGVLDGMDAYPNHWEASVDTDADGAMDFWRDGCDEQCRSGSDLVLDQFPSDADVSLDLDLDGRPDAWNPGCDPTCQSNSDKILDLSLNDYDNDGIDDLTDEDDDNCNGLDVDRDSDNLIDVPDLITLVLVALDPTGASLRTTPFTAPGEVDDVSGCLPRVVRGVLARECDGYELLTDLDFDTNGDGAITEDDVTCNPNDDGQCMGWVPIGKPSDDPYSEFQTNFEGNGHTISNLFMNRLSEAGLFGGTQGANIRNLSLDGFLAQVYSSGGAAGSLVAEGVATTITNCRSSVEVLSGGGFVGGLIGHGESVGVEGSFSTGHVAGFGDVCHVGGVAGALEFDSAVSATFASNLISGLCNEGTSEYPTSTGGLVGYLGEAAAVSASYSIAQVFGVTRHQGGLIGLSEEDVVNSYWAKDVSMIDTSAGSAQGADVAELVCPTEPGDTNCLPGVSLYTDWDQYAQPGGTPYWDLGNFSELPGLCLGGTLYRIDGAGTLQEPSDCACLGNQNELVTNQGFESGISGWAALGSSISVSNFQSRSGNQSLRITNRSNSWSGAQYDLLSQIDPGQTLSASLWTRIEGASNEPVVLTLRYTCSGVQDWLRIGEITARDNKWVNLTASVQVPECPLSELVAYAEGPKAGVTLYVDDVSLQTTDVACSGPSGEIDGSYTIYSSWNGGYCLEMVLSNPAPIATTSWSATVNLNGTTIDPNNYWNITPSGFSGTVTITPQDPWAEAIPAGGTSYSLGFCGWRDPGDLSFPMDPIVTANF